MCGREGSKSQDWSASLVQHGRTGGAIRYCMLQLAPNMSGVWGSGQPKPNILKGINCWNHQILHAPTVGAIQYHASSPQPHILTAPSSPAQPPHPKDPARPPRRRCCRVGVVWLRGCHVGVVWQRGCHVGVVWQRSCHVGVVWQRGCHVGVVWQRGCRADTVQGRDGSTVVVRTAHR
eukprot:354182-Chlamydomonas_euryale.AAC.3